MHRKMTGRSEFNTGKKNQLYELIKKCYYVFVETKEKTASIFYLFERDDTFASFPRAILNVLHRISFFFTYVGFWMRPVSFVFGSAVTGIQQNANLIIKNSKSIR